MRILPFILSTSLQLALANAALADGVIGLSAPLSGPSKVLGEQMKAGVEAALSLIDDDGFSLSVADDACTAQGGAAAARGFVEARVRIVVGYLCSEAIDAAMPILKQAGIPVITVGVRSNVLTDDRRKTGWPVHRLGPRDDSEQEAAGRLLTRAWSDELFAIVDDGTIYGRELAESFRLAVDQAALKPVFVDTFRPQLEDQIALAGRLRRAGATHVFAGGDRDDIAIIARDAARLQAGIVVAGGEALRADGAVRLPSGTLMVGLPEWTVGDPTLAKIFADRTIVPEGYVLPSVAATQVAVSVIDAAGIRQLPDDWSGRSFDTDLGPIRFDAKGDLATNPYRLFRFDGTAFAEVEEP